MSEVAIRVQDLSKRYQIYDAPMDRLKQVFWRGRKQLFTDFWALKDVSLTIRKGETVGLIGCNGSGKSTLLQLICGVLNLTRGDIFTHGRIAALLELGAGFNPDFSGRDNVYMNASILGLSQKEIDESYEDIVSFADIGDFIDRPVKTYSSGMYVRLAFATAINVSPDILVVDEALSVGDIRFQQKCIQRIKNFCQKGTVIFVSHDLASITELCTRAIWMNEGSVVMDGHPKLVAERYAQFMYEGKIETDAEETPLSAERVHVLPSRFDGFNVVEEEARQFGTRVVRIVQWRMLSDGKCNGVVYSGKPCEIGFVLSAEENLNDPIVGFMVKDRLGREILGDNNALAGKPISSLEKGGKYRVGFAMSAWPNLCEGEYTLSIAVAQGTFESHSQCHWLHDVYSFRSVPARKPVGLFSVLDTEILLREVEG